MMLLLLSHTYTAHISSHTGPIPAACAQFRKVYKLKLQAKIFSMLDYRFELQIVCAVVIHCRELPLSVFLSNFGKSSKCNSTSKRSRSERAEYKQSIYYLMQQTAPSPNATNLPPSSQGFSPHYSSSLILRFGLTATFPLPSTALH